MGLVFGVAVPVLVLACYPPTGFDAGLYPLPFAERFIEAGRLVFAPEHYAGTPASKVLIACFGAQAVLGGDCFVGGEGQQLGKWRTFVFGGNAVGHHNQDAAIGHPPFKSQVLLLAKVKCI